MLTLRIFRRLLATLLLFQSGLAVNAQDDDFGRITADELAMKECPFDKNAEAVILLDKAVASFDENHHLIVQRRIRVKVLKEKGVQRANIQIPYYHADDFEFIRDLKAVVLNPQEGGGFTTTPLERKNIFKRQQNQLYSAIIFALPNVGVGSIFEYSYTTDSKNHAALKSWEFQADIPTVTSSYELAPIPNSEFAYSVYKQKDFPIKITPDRSNGRIHFLMNNIPGLRDEVFSPSPNKYLQRVNFQFASYTSYMGKKDFTATWSQLTKELLAEKAFGGQVKKDLSGTDLLKSLPSSMTPLEKLRTIHDFVRSSVEWDGITSRYCESGVKTVLEKRKGNNGEINLMLVSLLRSAGLEVYPMLACERRYGKVDTTYPYIDQFNLVAAYAVVDGKSYVLDGTDAHTPFFLVPPDLQNTVGYIVDGKQQRFVYFNNLPQRQHEIIQLSGSVSPEGVVSGSALVTDLDYSKLAKKRRFGPVLHPPGNVEGCPKFERLTFNGPPALSQVVYRSKAVAGNKRVQVAKVSALFIY